MQFPLSRTLRNADEKSYTNSVLAPSGLVSAKITLDIPTEDATDPTTNCEAGLEHAPAGTSDADWPTVARPVATVSYIGNPANDPTQMPYVSIGATTLAFLAGRRVRGYLLTHTAGKQVGATLDVV